MIQLSAISNRITRKNKDNKLLIPLTISAKDGLINQYEYFDKQVASKNLSNYYEIYRGEFAYNKSYSNGFPFGTIKRLDYYDVGALSSLYICFSIKNINSDYLVHYFDSNKWNKEIANISGEGARNHGLLNLSANDFFNIKIWIAPSMVEQIKISTLLTLLNKKMDLIEQKISILKKYKIGLVNNWFNNDKNHVKLASLVHNKASQLLTSHISNNKGIYAVYDASGTPYKSIDFYNTEADSISIIKYGSGCGRTFIAKGKHSVLGTMVELIPNNEKNLMYLYAYTLSNSFKKICKKYIEIGTTPNLYYSDFSKADVYYPNNRDLFIIVFETLMKIEDNLYLSLNNIKLLKEYLLNTLFI